LQNGNLIVSAYDGKIYIFKIKDDSYEKILEFEDESEHILGVIELKNKNILTFSKSKAIKIYNYNEKDKNYKLQYKSIIETEDEEIYTVKFEDSKDSETILLMTDKEMGIFNYKKGIYETKIVCQEPWYGYDVCFFRNNLYLEGNMNIYIKDRKTLETKSFVELHESYQLDADLFYELKDGSFLCGMSNKYNNILRQYVYSNNNIIELSKLSFAGYKDHFNFIYQLKNGNIICSITNEEYFILK
jgi:WD40 repeat protein